MSGPIPGSQATVHGKVDLDRQRIVSTTTLTGPRASGRVRLISDGPRVWLTSTLPQVASVLPAGRKWVQTTLSELEARGIGRPPEAPPTLYLVRGAGAVTDEGPDVVDGVSVRRYSFPVDLHRAYCATPAAERQRVEAALHVTGPATLKAFEWVDAGGRAVEVSLTGDVSGPAGAIHLASELKISQLPAELEVAPPPAALVTPLSAVPGVAAALGNQQERPPPPVSCP